MMCTQQCNGLRVMTWNIYFGADLDPLVNTTPRELPERVTQVFNQFRQTDFPQRSKSIARQICMKEPDILCLQEAALWTVESECRNCMMDFISILVQDLHELGQDYRVVVISNNFRNRLESSTGDMIGLYDRDVILCRCDSPQTFRNVQQDNYDTNMTVSIGGSPFTVLRGWCSVDVCFDDQPFRCINTHLEGDSQDVRIAQTRELLQGPCNTSMPIVLAGDLNSDAEGKCSPAYDMLMDADFRDAWDSARRCNNGYTGFQARDLLNPVSTLDQRIDLILYRNSCGNGFDARAADTVGDRQRDRTPCCLWPSDHAGVAAILESRSGCPWF